MDILFAPNNRISRANTAPEWLIRFITRYKHIIPIKWIIIFGSLYNIDIPNTHINKLINAYNRSCDILYFNPHIYTNKSYRRVRIQKLTRSRFTQNVSDHIKIFYMAYYAYPDPDLYLIDVKSIRGLQPIAYIKNSDGIIEKYHFLIYYPNTELYSVIKTRVDLNIQFILEPNKSEKPQRKKKAEQPAEKKILVNRITKKSWQEILDSELIKLDPNTIQQYILPDAIKSLYETDRYLFMIQ